VSYDVIDDLIPELYPVIAGCLPIQHSVTLDSRTTEKQLLTPFPILSAYHSRECISTYFSRNDTVDDSTSSCFQEPFFKRNFIMVQICDDGLDDVERVKTIRASINYEMDQSYNFKNFG
jgi:hypothetical protein